MSRKRIEQAEKAGKDRARARADVQDKADKAERGRKFEDILSGAGRSKGCCELCNYNARKNDGEYQPCKMGHKDSGSDKEICADCSDSHYRP